MFNNRNMPNILVTGTPGSGKSSVCSKLAIETGMKWLKISQIAHKHNFLENYDKRYKCAVLNEDKLLVHLEPIMVNGGKIVEYHSSELFPERWFDAVIVLRVNTEILYDRLVLRGYDSRKLEENISCEIFGTAFEEAHSSYKPEIVSIFENNTVEDLDDCIVTIRGWIEWWKLETKNNER